MTRDRFTVIRYDYTVDCDAADSILTDETSDTVDVRGALDALDSDSWDNVDERDAEVILYPADWSQDFRTGEVTHTDVVIRADRPENLRRLMALWEHSARRSIG